MSDLGDALSWAALSTQGSERDRWLFQRGAWLAARGETSSALEALAQSHDDRARALAGRLWVAQGTDTRAAAECFRAIESEAISLHPQIVIERDMALAALGPETLGERRRWLDAVSALDDEWLAERRASLFIDAGESQAASTCSETPASNWCISATNGLACGDRLKPILASSLWTTLRGWGKTIWRNLEPIVNIR